MRTTNGAVETQTIYAATNNGQFPYKLRDSAFDVVKGLLSNDGDELDDAPLFRN